MESPNPDWRPDWRIVALILGVGLLVFGGSLNDGFHFDDRLILDDANVTHPDQWPHFLNPLRLRQVTFFSFYLNHRVGGEDAAGYHAVSVALHLANSVLLYILLGPFIGAGAGAAALLFLVHPVQTEAVLYVYQRSTLLAVFFSLWALILARARSGRHSPARVAGIVVLFALATWSKESALAAPLLLLIFTGLRHRIARVIVVLVGAGVGSSLALLAWLGEGTVGFGMLGRVDPWTYFLTEVRVLYTYLRLMVWPYPQALEYDVMPAGSVFEPSLLLALAGLALMLWGVVRLLGSPRFRWAGISAAAFFILLLPTSSLIPSRDFAFEHRLYLPMLGFAVFVAFWLGRFRYPTAALLLVVLAWAGLSVNRGRVWASDVTLWEDTVRKAPGKSRAWFNLGGAYMQTEDPRSRDAFLRVLELEPGSTEAFYNLGVIAQGSGDNVAAIGWYERALGTDPGYWPALNNIGNTRFALSDQNGAVDAYLRTLDLNPDYWPAQHNLAIVYTAMNRPDLAVPRLRIVLDWDEDFSEARYLLALSLQQLGQTREAAEEYERIGEEEQNAFRASGSLPPLSAPR